MTTGGAPVRPLTVEDLIKYDPATVGRWFAMWVDIVENHYDLARESLDKGDTGDPDRTRKARHGAILVDRKRRDLLLHALSSFPSHPSPRSMGELARVLREQDRLVDGLLGSEPLTGAAAAVQATEAVNLLMALKLGARNQAAVLERAYRRWRWRAVAAVAGGIVVTLAGFAALRVLGGWLGITVIAVGLLAAMGFTYTAMSDLVDWWRLALTGLPALVALLVVLGALVLGQRQRELVAAGVVAALIGLAVLAAVATSSDPERDLDGASHHTPPLPAGPRTGTDRVDQLAAELMEAEAVVESCSRRERRSARRWLQVHIIVGGAAALASGAAGVALNAGDVKKTTWLQTVVTVLALGGAGLTALATTLNPGKRSESASLTAASCDALAREIGVITRVDLDHELGPEGGREALEDVLIRYDALVGVKGRDSLWSRLHGFGRADRAHSSGPRPPGNPSSEQSD